MKVYPYKKRGGGRKRFSHAEAGGGGGHTKLWGSVYVAA